MNTVDHSFETLTHLHGWTNAVKFAFMYRGDTKWIFNSDNDWFSISSPIKDQPRLILQDFSGATCGHALALFHFHDVVGGDGPMEGTYLSKAEGVGPMFDLVCTCMEYMEGLVTWSEIRHQYSAKLAERLAVEQEQS